MVVVAILSTLVALSAMALGALPGRARLSGGVLELNAALAACVGGWVRDALAASQALEADFLGVGQAVAVRSGRRWAAIRDGWAELWPDVPVRVTVDADVGRTYDLRDGIDTTGGGR